MPPTPTPAELLRKHAKPVAAGTPPVDEATVRATVAQLPGWEFTNGEVAKTFPFKDYHQTMAFVNATAWVSHREDHHPDLEVGYNKCRVRYSTHSIGGISENDLICAAKIESLFSPA
jgi:4a-hydroxytetrahydrobiopterin dehydratase